MNKKTIRVAGVILLLLIIFAGILLSRRAVNNKKTAEMETIYPAYGNIYVSVSATGTVSPQNRLEIKPPIAGRIDRILVKEGERVTTGQVLALMSSVERAALLDAARLNDEKTVQYWQTVYNPTPLLAPINGEVIVSTFEPGQTVVSGDAVIVLSDRLIVKVEVDETDIGKVKTGQEVIISLDAYPEIKVKGKVGHISYESQVVNNVTTYEVDVIPATVPRVFRSGMNANVEIIQEKKEGVLLVPLKAVQENGNGNSFVLKLGADQKTVWQKVEAGISDEKNKEVISGLTPDDTVIITTEKYSPSNKKPAGGNPLLPFGGRRPR